MIRFSNVKKSYRPESHVLTDVNIDIEKGDFVCLTGASGAGKSTLLKLMFGSEFASEGIVEVDGKNVADLSMTQMASLRRMIGVIFQDFKLISWRNVFDNVALSLEIRGESPRYIEEKVRNVLRWVDLEEKKLEYPEHLSGGEQQRVAIARALAADPKILFADEPTGNLDPGLAQEILDLLRKINTRGMTVVLASHDLALVRKVANREIVIKNGRVFA